MMKQSQTVPTTNYNSIFDGNFVHHRHIYIDNYGAEPYEYREYNSTIDIKRIQDILKDIKAVGADWKLKNISRRFGIDIHENPETATIKQAPDYHWSDAAKSIVEIFMMQGLLISINIRTDYTGRISVSSDKKTVDGCEADFIEVFRKYSQANSKKIHIICASSGGFYTESFDIQHKDFNYDHYNDGFEEVDSHIKNTLANTSKGIVLLHGLPGTGKTSYIRHLISHIDKKMIYMPPDLSHKIASPDFISFLMENPNSVLILEDAETILETREAGGSQAIANLLNVGDGILGDALKISVVCTFNTAVHKIDSALLRKGRLIAKHEFVELSESKTSNLYSKLYDVPAPNKKMTLAEIFNAEIPTFHTEKPQQKVGFY